MLYSAYRLVRLPPEGAAIQPIPTITAALLGVGIGLMSALTGIGGGVLLGPLLVTRRWAEPRDAAGASAALNLTNSLAALTGDLPGLGSLPLFFPGWALAALAGAVIGSGLGARRLGGGTLRHLLAGVLGIVGVKLILA